MISGERPRERLTLPPLRGHTRAVDEVILARLVAIQAGVTTETPVHESLDPWELILDASAVVQSVLFILLMMGLTSFFIIGAKAVRFIQANGSSRRFLATFWSERDEWNTERLEALYAQLKAFKNAPVAEVYRAGYVELAKVMSAAPSGHEADLENVQRAVRRAASAEIATLENLLPFLATTGSAAPFIGLFGTVWGIMDSFLNIGAQQSASLDVVAPGIAEALIATAVGLVAAIPAVIAYNYFVRKIQVLEVEMEAFASDYLNIVRRHFLRG